MTPMFIILQALNGLTIAAIYTILAAGLTIVLGMQRIVNNAHGAFYMLGAYISLTAISHLGFSFWLSIPLAFLVSALFGAVLEMTGIRMMTQKKREPHYPMMMTLGIAMGAGEVVKIVWGAVPQMAEVPEVFTGVLVMGPIIYPKYWLFVIVLTAFIMAGLWMFFNLTDLGIMVRAVAMNNEMAQVMGTNAPRLNTIVFAVGSGLAGIGGVLAAPILGVDPNMGLELLLILFVIIIMGGLGSLWGGVVSAVIIGEIIAFGTGLASGMVAKLIVFGAMILILIIKPHGFFGRGAEID